MIQPQQPFVRDTPLKRFREEVYVEEQTNAKVPNHSKSKISTFSCPAYYNGVIDQFQLSQVFMSFKYAILFFCDYDFSPQSKQDLSYIEEYYQQLVNFGAFPIVITHDRAQIHRFFATPGLTAESLTFRPSFLMASDSIDRLIARSFKSINFEKNDIQRSVIILDRDLQVLFNHKVPDKLCFPMKSILQCFEQTRLH